MRPSTTAQHVVVRAPCEQSISRFRTFARACKLREQRDRADAHKSRARNLPGQNVSSLRSCAHHSTETALVDATPANILKPLMSMSDSDPCADRFGRWRLQPARDCRGALLV